jgi:hypothetical protein
MVDKEDLEALFSGFTGPEDDDTSPSEDVKATKPKEKKKKGRPKTAKESEEVHLCTIVDKELLWKIRTIATREGLQIKDVIGAAFTKAVKSYERKHGTIEDDGKTKLSDLF